MNLNAEKAIRRLLICFLFFLFLILVAGFYDWGAVDEIVNSLAAGMEPSSNEAGERKLIEAVQSGKLSGDKNIVP
ncbi:hypothetical protein [Paenibacillus lautus]|uniref:hypothetical protein n=1 Tax=Paenibacillus lautus TaxID=1401 RepID=UPI001C7DB4BA|nr:hypothetical protein [Paenibacillus lautus]MBX4148604.1 hypothetical protein [Paenibacillus lautus]